MLGTIGPAMATQAASYAVPGLGWAKLGLDLLGGGMFGGSTKQTSIGAAYSGFGSFAPSNSFDGTYREAWIDLDDPVHILVAGAFLVGAIYAWKRLK